MRFVAVTACPTGIAHTVMAAAALKRQAEIMGHQIDVETQGADGTQHPLPQDAIDKADAVIIAADIYIDPSRFAGKPVRAVSTADAIRHTHDVLEDAASSTNEPDDALPTPAPRRAEPEADGADGAADGRKRIVGITSCPTGIAHTFMAAEGLRKAAEGAGHWIKVETQGSVGAKNVLTEEDIAGADTVVIAADTKVNLSRFVGKPVYQTGTKEALKHGDDVVAKALSGSTAVLRDAGGGGGGNGAAATGGGGGGGPKPSILRQLYQHLMTGISHMLPLIVAGGLCIAIGFAFDINANEEDATHFAARLFQIGVAAFSLFLPILAGYISYSIADRPGLAPGLIGGYLAGVTNTGFLGAILAGFLAGYLTRFFATHIKLPQTLQGLKPVLILPLLSTLVVGLGMFYVIGEPISYLQEQLTAGLTDMQGSSAALLGAVLGAMMAFDMGGPLNKTAYAFSVGLISENVTEPMAAVMAAGMTPPLALFLATQLFRKYWLPEEREAGKAAGVLGLSFITEGAIPFAARNPLRIIPCLMIGSAVAGAISLGFDAGTSVPHGGIINLFVPNAVSNVGAWGLAIVAGSVISAAALFAVMTGPARAKARAESAPAAAAAVPA
jgi:PTS system fructose-specific IIC component